MKVLFIAIVLLLLAGLTFGLDFRSSSWGDTKDSVIKMEGTPSDESVGDSGWNQGMILLFYDQVSVLDRIARAMYGFENNSLVMGKYILGGLTGFFEYEVDSISEQLSNALIQKYGPVSYDAESPYWLTPKGIVSLWKIKRGFGTTIIIVDYYEKDFFLRSVANREQL